MLIRNTMVGSDMFYCAKIFTHDSDVVLNLCCIEVLYFCQCIIIESVRVLELLWRWGLIAKHMSHSMTKPTKWHVRPAKTQISLGIRPVWPESSQCAQWEAKDSAFLHADSEDSDQTRRMPRLIWAFAGRTGHFVGFVVMRLTYTENKSLGNG